ncbi:MAG: hypothetical protein A3D41_04680 [Candidatus Sungbacteria bacterium RIFCSPHIGHO2_02_FULL_41_12b]|nr:MAG: hypothetical protein A3D41_04680 [Candidatus Sungbacteria bacterium RIFCSPHIGHO2_02_FULL_41_12b]
MTACPAVERGKMSGTNDLMRISAIVQDVFEPLHTGISLVFTIAPNGKVWGKRLDVKSTSRDVELEIFSGTDDGYVLWKLDGGNRVRRYPNVLTIEQRRKVDMIMFEERTITHLLSTIVVLAPINLPDNYLPSMRPYLLFRGLHEQPALRRNIFAHVVDCSDDSSPLAGSKGGLWSIQYCDKRFSFVFFDPREQDEYLQGRKLERNEYSIANVCLHQRAENNKTIFPRHEFYAVQAQNGEFDLFRSGAFQRQKLFLRSVVRVTYGGHDFFDYFKVDDVLLLLEEFRTTETDSEFTWTIAVAQNKFIRNILRLHSNSKTLFQALKIQK